MTSRLCWNCKFFIADDPETSLSGICVRHAPRGRDFSSYLITGSLSFSLTMGYFGDAALVSGGLLPLTQSGLYTDFPTCNAVDSLGIRQDDILPFAIVPGYNVRAVSVVAARMNTGAGTVGTNPVLHLQKVNVFTSNQTFSNLADIPITPSDVQPNGTTIDRLARGSAIFDPNDALYNLYNCSGFRLDLTGTTENDIAEIRNLMLTIVFGSSQYSISNTPPHSKGKFGQIFDGSTEFCGEFNPKSNTIPEIPVIP